MDKMYLYFGKVLSQIKEEMKEIIANDEYIANGIKVTHTSVSLWMSGNSIPHLKNLKKLIKFLQIEIENAIFNRKKDLPKRIMESVIRKCESDLELPGNKVNELKKTENINAFIEDVLLLTYHLDKKSDTSGIDSTTHEKEEKIKESEILEEAPYPKTDAETDKDAEEGIRENIAQLTQDKTANLTGVKINNIVFISAMVLIVAAVIFAAVKLSLGANNRASAIITQTPTLPANLPVETPGSLLKKLTDPIKLSAYAANGKVNLKWESSAVVGVDISGFNVYRGKSPKGEDAIPITDFPLNVLEYTDMNVSIGNTYYYCCKAVFTDNSESEASNEVSVKINNQEIILEVGDPYMLVNGIRNEIDPGKGTAPIIYRGRTLMPIRLIIEAMGGTVDWEKEEQKITIKLNQRVLELWIGNNKCALDGVPKETDIAPEIIDSRTMVPLKFVMESLGCDVEWDGTTKKIFIAF